MSDGKMFRWYTDEEIEEIKKTAIEAAVRGVLAIDTNIYDEETIRAVVETMRVILKEKK